MAIPRFWENGMSGAQAVQLMRKSMFRFNVEDYGAVHDGVIDPSNGNLTSGTDDTVAIQAAILDAWENGCSEVFFPNGVYRISGPLITSYNGQNPNCQIYIPINSNSETAKTIRFIGEAPAPTLTSVITTLYPHTTGAILYSDIDGGGTFPSVFGGKNNIASFGKYFINCDVDFENISIRVKANHLTTGPTMCGINAENYSNFGTRRVRVDISVANQLSIQPSNNVFAIKCPNTDLNSRVQLNETLVTGFKHGYIFNELSEGTLVQAFGCENAFVFDHMNHSAYFGSMIASGCINAIVSARSSNGYTGTSPYKSYLRINTLHWEKGTYSGKWYAPVNTVLDSNNDLHGTLYHACVEAGFGFNPAVFVKTGGANITTSSI